MANKGVKGRVVDAVSSKGIGKLTVKVVDFDPFFNEDDKLATGLTDDTDGNRGDFNLTYSPKAYSLWKADRKPDLVVRVYNQAGRLLHETKEVENVTDETLVLPDIRIHPNNVDGWLVTHATLKPQDGTPVSLFSCDMNNSTTWNGIDYLIDGGAMFPAVTDAASAAEKSLNLMTLGFDVKNDLKTKFKSTLSPTSPPATNCKAVIEPTLEEILKQKAKAPNGKTVNVMVNNIPLSTDDNVAEVKEFFENSGVETTDFNKGFVLLHAKAIIQDGVKAILMGSPLKQGYFSDTQHHILDIRHNGSLMHDVSIQVTGPAVAQVNSTFATVWKSTGKSLGTAATGSSVIPPREKAASVQVLRTLPGGTFKLDASIPHGETGILEAYQRAIANAEHYIYFENQYFTSPEIVDALIKRMEDPNKTKLQIILVLNFRPDMPGYPDQQVQLVNQLKNVAQAKGHQFGVYTLWSRSEVPGSGQGGAKKKFRIMPIYVHSKTAVIDDKWATVGSANLDGTSMNYHQIGMIVGSILLDKVRDKIELENDPKEFVMDFFNKFIYLMLSQLSYTYKAVLAIIGILVGIIVKFNEIMEILGEASDIVDIVEQAFTRTSEHALPERSSQPARSIEMNLVLYNGVAGQPETPVIRELREKLWQEHLGLESLPADLQNVSTDPSKMKWVDFWNTSAQNNLEAMKNNQSLPDNNAPKILKWTGDTDAKHYLQDLKIRTDELMDKALFYDFKECKYDIKRQGIKEFFLELLWPF